MKPTLFHRLLACCIGVPLILLIAILLHPTKEAIIVFSIIAVCYDAFMIWMYRISR